MENSLANKKIISIIIVLLLLLNTKIYAVNDNYSTTINVNNYKAKRGEEVVITIGLTDIKIVTGEKGLGAYVASIEFDSSVFEYCSTGSTDKWEAPFYKDGLITGNTKDGEVISTTQSIGTITFKVKDNAKLGDTTISLTNFSASTAETDVATSNKSVRISILDKENNNNANNGNNNSNNNNNSNTGNNNNKPGNSNNGNTGNNNKNDPPVNNNHVNNDNNSNNGNVGNSSKNPISHTNNKENSNINNNDSSNLEDDNENSNDNNSLNTIIENNEEDSLNIIVDNEVIDIGKKIEEKPIENGRVIVIVLAVGFSLVTVISIFKLGIIKK